MKKHYQIVPSLLAAAILLALSIDISAQQATPAMPEATGTTELQTVIVTGTRAGKRTESSSLTPIDVVPASVLLQTGAVTLSSALERAIPSLNFPNPSSADNNATQRPVQLRGLSPDEVLVLVDGKRWHTSALLNTLGYAGAGTGVDLNTIPLSAIDHIEVLRDGASAQYGSDAIAGVVNVILKKGAKGGDVQVTGGQYSAGDGRQWNGSANFGVPLGGGDDNWLRLAVQKGNEGNTNRAGVDTRPGFTYLGQKFAYGNTGVKDQNVMLNMQYNITPGVQFYAFGHYGQRIGHHPAFYRYGTNTPSPNNPLVGEVYPDGFLPIEHSDSIDRSLVAGLRGKVNGWRWDVSANAGMNRVFTGVFNTTNYALLNDFGSSPTAFHVDTSTASQQAFDVDISKDITVGWLPDAVTTSFGAQWLRQGFQEGPGDPASYYTGTSGVAGGAQGDNGTSADNAVSAARRDLSEYVQLETNLTDKLGVSVAGRHEHYSDFGAATTGQLSARFDFTDSFALRASASTAFHAPTMAQENSSGIGNVLYPAGNVLGLPPGLYNRGRFRVNDPFAELLGSEPLKAEKSHNYTFGAVWNPGNAFTMSIDAYQITISDRVELSGTLAITSPTVRDYLAAHGIANSQVAGIAYFTNAVSTRNQGIDLVSTYRSDFGNAGTLMTTLSATYNKGKVIGIAPNPPILESLGTSLQRVSRSFIKGWLADSTPRSKVILNEAYHVGQWDFNATATRYGRITVYSDTSYLFDQVFAHKWLLDLTANYSTGPWTFTLGGNNVLNTYPTRNNDGNSNHGVFPYPAASPFGFNGAYVYGKVRYSW